MSYVKYQCTKCRRIKTLEKDDSRFTPDQCTITKGCLGNLLIVGTSAQRDFTSTVSGVEDWYPRGQTKSQVVESPNTDLDTTLSISSAGGLVLAIPSVNPISLPDKLYLALEQRQILDIPYQHFSFKVLTTNNLEMGKTIINGKDINGKNIRFDQSAINENRIVVRVDGVDAIDYTIIPNQVTFQTQLSLSSSVDVIVYNQKRVVEKAIVFTRNKSQIPSIARGAWSNIDFIIRNKGGISTRCYLYGVNSPSDLTSGTIRITGNTVSQDAFFLLAAEPYEAVDRYMNFLVEQNNLTNDFEIKNDSGQLMIKESLIDEIYPPLGYDVASFISDDLFTTSTSSQVITDTDKIRKSGKIIMGPI